MEISVQTQKEGKIFSIEVSPLIDFAHLSCGQMFPVTLKHKTTHTTLEACVLADRRSLLIGEHVVRLVQLKRRPFTAHVVRPVQPKKSAASKGSGMIKSPLTGKVISVAVKSGDVVKEGDLLLVIEAMKMENRILAEWSGTVKQVHVSPGQSVATQAALLSIEGSAS